MSTVQGTERVVNWTDGPRDVDGNVQIHQRFYTEDTDVGKVVGKTLSVLFTIDTPAKQVWPHLKDFNPWQNAYGHFYSGVLGDLEGQTVILTDKSNEPGDYPYQVLRVIPEHLIVLSQPLSEDCRAVRMSPDCHVFMLNEHAGKSIVTGLMEHASYFEGVSEEETLRPYRTVAAESQRKWRDVFIPTLKN